MRGRVRRGLVEGTAAAQRLVDVSSSSLVVIATSLSLCFVPVGDHPTSLLTRW